MIFTLKKTRTKYSTNDTEACSRRHHVISTMAKVTKNDGDGDTNKKQTNTKHQMTRKNKKILLGENGEDTPVRSK